MKCLQPLFRLSRIESRPTRGAWIEMRMPAASPAQISVAPHTGRVD